MTILLTKKQVAARVGLHAEHVMRMAREGRFPKPVKLGPQPGCAARFVEDEVEAWVRDRMAERNHASANSSPKIQTGPAEAREARRYRRTIS